MLPPDLTVESVMLLIENGIKVCDMEPENQKMQYLKVLFQQQYELLSSKWERDQKIIKMFGDK